MVHITECPRDAMQGIINIIPTQQKIDYLNSLMHLGFDVLDFGSFVSPKAIPQLSDTAAVIEKLNLDKTKTKLLAIIATPKGADIAAQYEQISYLGYPFSFSETFLKKNLNSSIDQAIRYTDYFQKLCTKENKFLLQYISMAFGNPYGDAWTYDILYRWIKQFDSMGIKNITLSDVTGEANATQLFEIYSHIIPAFPHIKFGLHLHQSPQQSMQLVDSAYRAGCRHFDTVLNDKGGCPMSGKGLVQNLNTFEFLTYLEQNNIAHSIEKIGLTKSLEMANLIF